MSESDYECQRKLIKEGVIFQDKEMIIFRSVEKSASSNKDEFTASKKNSDK